MQQQHTESNDSEVQTPGPTDESTYSGTVPNKENDPVKETNTED